MGLVQSHFAGTLVAPLKRAGDEMLVREGRSVPSDLGHTVQDFALGRLPNLSRTTSSVIPTPSSHTKRKFCEDQDSVAGPPCKVSRSTSPVAQTPSLPIPPSPPVIPSLKRKISEDLALGPPPKIPRTSSLADLAGLSPEGTTASSGNFLMSSLGKSRPSFLQTRSWHLLRLTNTGLKAVQWTSLLRNLRFRCLRSLVVEAICPTRSLVEFLSRHQVDTLTIIGVTARLSPLPRSPLRRTRPMTLLPSLTRLDGSPSHILSLFHYAYIPGTLEYLRVRLGVSSFMDCFLSDVLSCAEHLSGVGELFVRIPAEADLRALALPQKSSRTCPVKIRDLTLRILGSKSDDSAIWLSTFSEIKDLYLCADSSRSDDELEHLLRSFSPPSNHLKITILRM
ncbi:hypothetical protein EDD15DRAFT_2366461 [Pisolithus albus]|nr:hypothetical protein EDD15DRAFT_2366461 [Pisolithus albus]